MEGIEGVHASGDIFDQEPSKEEKSDVSLMRHLVEKIPICNHDGAAT